MEKGSRKVSQKPEVGGPKSEEKLKEKKPEVGSPKSVQKDSSREEENTSAPDSYRDDIPQSALNKQSEIKELPTANSKLPTENTMEVHHHPEVE